MPEPLWTTSDPPWLVSRAQATRGARRRGSSTTLGTALDLGDGTFWVTLVFTEHPSQKKDESGRVVEDFPTTDQTQADLTLEWRDGTWLVQGLSHSDATDRS